MDGGRRGGSVEGRNLHPLPQDCNILPGDGMKEEIVRRGLSLDRYRWIIEEYGGHCFHVSPVV